MDKSASEEAARAVADRGVRVSVVRIFIVFKSGHMSNQIFFLLLDILILIIILHL
jgi:hypothetical protein